MQRRITLVSITLILLTLFFSQAHASQLSDTAASMQPGTWASLTTNNVDVLQQTTGSVAGGTLFGYSQTLSWNPGTKQAFYIGSDHNYPGTDMISRFVRYNDNTNSWENMPNPAWFSVGTMHQYDHMTINPTTGTLYYKKGNTVHSYNIAQGTWGSVPIIPTSTYQCCEAIEYFPELGGLVFVGTYGEVWKLADGAGQWTKLGEFNFGAGASWIFAEYNPKHKLLVFGNDYQSLYKLSSSGVITQLNNPPVDIYLGGPETAPFIADPISGDYLLLSDPARQLYTYNVLTDTWLLSPSQPPPSTLQNSRLGATYISDYNVFMVAHCVPNCGVHLYKHSAGGGISDTTPPSVPGNLAASVISSSQINLVWNAATDNVGVNGYKIYRNNVQVGTATTTSYSDTGLIASTLYNYRVGAYDSAGNHGGNSSQVSATTLAPDIISPTVSISTPSNGASITGSITITASASDNVGVAGVQFLLDGAHLQAEDTSSPHSISWDSRTTTNGSHTLSARARDTSNNIVTSTPVTITVANAPVTAATLVDFGGASASNTFGLSGWNTVIKDVYTDNVNLGPGGMTIVIANNADYNYQGVQGTPRTFTAGETITVTWYNNGASAITFTPKISLDDPDRKISGTGGTWYDMTQVTIQPGSTSTTDYTITATNTYSLVNINVNYQNSQTLIADKIILNTAGGTTSDTLPPILSNGQPSGTLSAGTTSTTMSVTTSEAATCRYGSTTNTAYNSMTNTFATTGGTSHSTTISGLANGQSYTRYIRCIDTNANANTADFVITFSVGTSTGGGVVGGYPMPTLQDEKNTYTRWGWTWNTNQESSAITDPIASYSVVHPDIHGDTEGDDLWTYLQMYRRTGNPIYLNRANAWRNYLVNDYFNGPEYLIDRNAYVLDHFYGYGLLLKYQYDGDVQALNTAQAMAADLEFVYGPSTTLGCLRDNGCIYGGTRAISRHLIFITRLADVTGNPRWATLRDTILDKLLTTTYWDENLGMYFSSHFTDEQLGAGAYASGARLQPTFMTGVLSEALFHTYQTTGNQEIKRRLIKMARFVDQYGMDPVFNYTADYFGVVNGAPWHRFNYGNPYTYGGVYSTEMTNLLIMGYKFTGDTTLLNRAKYFFNRGTKASNFNPSQPLVPDNTVGHFIDTRFASSSGNFYLDYNRGELLYTYLIFENGGLPTIEGNTPPTTPGDLNGDRTVNIIDLNMVVADFGKTSGFNPVVDTATPFGVINLFDVMTVVTNWGKTY